MKFDRDNIEYYRNILVDKFNEQIYLSNLLAVKFQIGITKNRSHKHGIFCTEFTAFVSWGVIRHGRQEGICYFAPSLPGSIIL